MNNYSGMQSVVLISLGSYFSSVFENSVVFSGVVGMGLLWTILILSLFLSGRLDILALYLL